jgi:predicted ATPase/class 3 adenylate cyclase
VGPFSGSKLAVSLPQSLPSGTVAFLFTDIEGSTARWDLHRVAMQEALRRHDGLMRAAIQSHRGVVFKTIGDAFCAAFEQAADALNAALTAQRDIAAQNWEAINGLRVRMAVHAGESDERDGDYFGPAVNRVARLLSAAHGGQVLVSGDAADLAVPNLQDGVGLRSLGMLPLRGLRQPERVFQLIAPGLRTAFKPLRELATPPNNLPRRPSTFVGRREDVERIEKMLRESPLVTIVGTGGVGKTRLALEAADDLLNDMRDGAWFVDLAPLSVPSLVAGAALSSLGVDQTSDSDALDIIIGYLKKRELLLVFDNCEHLVAEVARVVSAIVAACPLVTVMATSREALNIDCEQVYRLASLSDADAIELFAQRAQAVGHAFRLDDGNRASVEDLCRRLDGIALAIELAAARIRSISLDELSRRLRLRLLVGGPRDRQARQRTMQALIDWSYELLAPRERNLFRVLSVFSGGFTLDDAAAVTGGDANEVLDELTSLVDKSLLAIAADRSEARYRLLEPIREYARERLDETGTSDDVLRQHALTFAVSADRSYVEWDTAPATDWLARTASELDNVRAALEWALGSEQAVDVGARIAAGASPMYLRLSLLREGIGWGERALAFAAQLGAAICAQLHYGLSMLYHNQGANARALAAARLATELYRESGDERGLTRALSQIAHHLGDAPQEAQAVAEEALRRARGINDARLLAMTLQRCAFVYAPEDIAQARACFQEAVALFRSFGRDDESARALAAWADAEGTARNFEEAASIAREALDLGGGDVKMYLNNALAALYVALGDRHRASAPALEALRLGVESAHPVVTPLAIFHIAAIVSESEPSIAARLAGYSHAQLQRLEWKTDGPDGVIERKLEQMLERSLPPSDREALRAAGAAWTEADAVAAALGAMNGASAGIR